MCFLIALFEGLLTDMVSPGRSEGDYMCQPNQLVVIVTQKPYLRAHRGTGTASIFTYLVKKRKVGGVEKAIKLIGTKSM